MTAGLGRAALVLLASSTVFVVALSIGGRLARPPSACPGGKVAKDAPPLTIPHARATLPGR